MSVYITHAGSILGIPIGDDLTPEQLCDDDCRSCLLTGTSSCPARMRQFELVADSWMLDQLEIQSY